MIRNIKDGIDNYLDFDSNEMFVSGDYITIFGGALRDIVAGQEDKINDIDILCLPVSKRSLENVLMMNGYTKMNLIKPDLNFIYKDIRYIFEPSTYINSKRHIVQLIRPTNSNCIMNNHRTSSKIYENYYTLLKNVDLVSSGLFYDGNNLYESVNGAYNFCKNKITKTLDDALMYNINRTYLRKEKLLYNGWKDYDRCDEIYKRSLKIESLKINIDKFINIKTMCDFVESHNNTYSVDSFNDKFFYRNNHRMIF